MTDIEEKQHPPPCDVNKLNISALTAVTERIEKFSISQRTTSEEDNASDSSYDVNEDLSNEDFSDAANEDFSDAANGDLSDASNEEKVINSTSTTDVDDEETVISAIELLYTEWRSTEESADTQRLGMYLQYALAGYKQVARLHFNSEWGMVTFGNNCRLFAEFVCKLSLHRQGVDTNRMPLVVMIGELRRYNLMEESCEVAMQFVRVLGNKLSHPAPVGSAIGPHVSETECQDMTENLLIVAKWMDQEMNSLPNIVPDQNIEAKSRSDDGDDAQTANSGYNGNNDHGRGDRIGRHGNRRGNNGNGRGNRRGWHPSSRSYRGRRDDANYNTNQNTNNTNAQNANSGYKTYNGNGRGNNGNGRGYHGNGRGDRRGRGRGNKTGRSNRRGRGNGRGRSNGRGRHSSRRSTRWIRRDDHI